MAQTTTTTQQPQRRLHAVPDQPTDDEEASPATKALIAALRESPDEEGATSAALAEQAQVGKSTARRLLSDLVEQGLVLRTPGCGGGPGRIPDRFRWAEQTPSGSGPVAVVDPPGHDETTTPATPDAGDTEEEPAADGPAAAASPAAPAITLVHATDEIAPDSGGEEGAVATEAQHTPAATGTSAEPKAGAESSPRLGKNALRGKVEQFLIEHPNQEFGPHALSQLLGHSSGAITNVLMKLVAAGLARQTQNHPRRFAASPNTDN